MKNELPALLRDLADKFAGFIPELLAGAALLIVGFLVAWFVKRLVIQLSIALRLDRFLARFRWGRAFAKADVHYGLYNFLGNIFFFFVILAFTDLAFIAWGLEFLSNLLGEAISLFPRLLATAIILGAGWLAARWAAEGLALALLRENIARATAIALYARIALVVFFAAMALSELDVAGNIVTIGFTTIFITLGIIAVLRVAMHGKGAVAKKSEPGADREKNGGE